MDISLEFGCIRYVRFGILCVTSSRFEVVLSSKIEVRCDDVQHTSSVWYEAAERSARPTVTMVTPI
jgi:hypothetical protein